MSIAEQVVVVSRCVRGIDDRGLHVTNLAALRDALRGVARPECVCLIDGFAVPEFGFEQRPIVGRRRDERGDRGGVDHRQGDAGSVHAAGGRAPPGLGVRDACRLLDAGAPGGDRASGRVAAAPDVVPVDRLPAARSVGRRPAGRAAPHGSTGRRRSGAAARARLPLVELDEPSAVDHDADGVEAELAARGRLGWARRASWRRARGGGAAWRR